MGWSKFHYSAGMMGRSQFPHPKRGPSLLTFQVRGSVYFDRSAIKRNWGPINKNPLEKAGHIVRLKARGSIRKGTISKKSGLKRHAVAGKPPKYWAGQGNGAPFKMIRSAPFNLGTSVIVGMVGFNRLGGFPIPGIHEHGAAGISRVVLRYEGLPPASEMPRDPDTGRFLPLSSKRGFMRRSAYQKFQRKRVSYPPRPFMYPAMLRTKQRYPALWRNAVGRARLKRTMTVRP